MKSQTFKGRIRISRVHGGGKDWVNITVCDDNHIEFFDGELSLEDYGSLISGLASPIEVTLRSLHNINKIREDKRINVKMPKEYGETYDSEKRRHIALEAIKPFEIDGWKANLHNISNSHYYSYDNINPSIPFVRYVNKEETNNG